MNERCRLPHHGVGDSLPVGSVRVERWGRDRPDTREESGGTTQSLTGQCDGEGLDPRFRDGRPRPGDLTMDGWGMAAEAAGPFSAPLCPWFYTFISGTGPIPSRAVENLLEVGSRRPMDR